MDSSEIGPSPDNLWIRIFGDEHAVPDDADETLALLWESISIPFMRQVMDLRYREGKSLDEIGSIVGRSSKQLRRIIGDAIRLMMSARYSYEREAELCFGIRIQKFIAEGSMGVCETCGKLIDESAAVFVVPDYDSFMWASPDNPAWKMYCSRECAEAAIAESVTRYKQDIQKLTSEILVLQNGRDGLEQRLQAIQKYMPESMTLQKAHDRIRKTVQENIREENGEVAQ